MGFGFGTGAGWLIAFWSASLREGEPPSIGGLSDNFGFSGGIGF